LTKLLYFSDLQRRGRDSALSVNELLGFYVSVFVASLGLGLHLYFVPIFAQTLGATFLDLGFIGTASALTYMVVPLFVGQLADRISLRVLYAVAIFINFIATLSLVFCTSVSDVVVNRVVAGFGFAFFWPTTEALVFDLTRREERVREMGRFSVSWGLAFLIGPFIGGVVIQSLGFAALFLVSCALSFSSLIGVVLFFSPTKISAETGEKPVNIAEQFRVIGRLWPWCGFIVGNGLIFSIVSSIFPGYANTIGVGAILVGSLFTLFGAARVASYAASERYLRFGERKALGVASLLLAVACVLIVWFPIFNVFLIAMPLMGACFAILFPLTIGLIARHFSERQLGAAVGFYENSYGIGTAIGPALAGILSAIVDVRLSFLSAAFAGALMMVVAFRAKTYEA